tara:strand:- start:533 stop:1315 length:783 start_codon:yes stop_codon:yes gene_type:complete
MYYSPLLSMLRLSILLPWTLICSFAQIFFFFFPRKFSFMIPKLYFKGLLTLLGISLKILGQANKKGTLFISNHTSYLDIIILGSEINGKFVAKSEISNWPIINIIVKLGKTIFINRKEILKSKNQVNILSQNLKDGFNVILFPEGTSNNGTQVLPFKSSLFGIVEISENKFFELQPVSISYRAFDGLPTSRIFKQFYAWYGSVDLAPHAWKLLGLGACEITINFHETSEFSRFKSRKSASKYCYDIISDYVSYTVNKFNL